MEIKKKLKNPMVINFISLALLQGVNYLLPLLSFPFLFRVLGVERWGLVTFGYALMQYFIMFTVLALTYQPRNISLSIKRI